jgi:hypothetical protein
VTIGQLINAPGYQRTGGYYGRFGPGGEDKFHDVDADQAPVSASGDIKGSLLTIPQDTTEDGRIGRQVFLKKVSLRFWAGLAGTNDIAATFDTVRIMLICDKQCNGANPSVTDVLESGDWMAFNNLANKGRFHTYFDKKIMLNALAGGGNTTNNTRTAAVGKYFEKHVKLNLPIEYDSDTGAVTEIRSNNVFLLYITDQGLATVECSMRFRYSDRS